LPPLASDLPVLPKLAMRAASNLISFPSVAGQRRMLASEK
jgi:hypothetical protein